MQRTNHAHSNRGPARLRRFAFLLALVLPLALVGCQDDDTAMEEAEDAAEETAENVEDAAEEAAEKTEEAMEEAGDEIEEAADEIEEETDG